MKTRLLTWILGSLLTLCVTMISSPALLGAEKENNSGMTAGISLGLSDANSIHHIGMTVRPNIGYRIDRNWEVGAFFRFENSGWDDRYYMGAVYGEYNFYPFTNKRFSLFVDLQAGKLWTPTEYGSDFVCPDNHDNKIDMEIGLVPGLKYHIPGTKAHLRLRYMFLGYNNCYDYIHGIGQGPWALDASLRRLEIGIGINF